MFYKLLKCILKKQYNKYNTTNKLIIMKLVLIKNVFVLYRGGRKNTKVSCYVHFQTFNEAQRWHECN